MSLETRVGHALRDAGVARGQRLLVAVSGGVDSMTLLEVLAGLRDRLGLRLSVAHVHHGLRGRAADRDAAFVVTEAARRGLAASVCRLFPAERPRGESLQVWARVARYGCLETIADRERASWIAVAHTQDDQAETVLLHLLRGTGSRGLRGIPPVRRRILRPLLSVSRADVEAYAAERHLAFRTDASNASDVYRRNRVRHHLLPLLAAEYNPRIVESLASLATQLSEDEATLTTLANSLLDGNARGAGPAICLGVAALRATPPAVARRAFQEAFQRVSQGRHGLTRRHLEALRGLLARERVVPLPGGFQAWRDEGAIRIERTPDPPSGSRPGARRSVHAGRTPGLDGRSLTKELDEIPLRPGVWAEWAPLNCRVRVRQVTRGTVPCGPRNPWRELLSPTLLDRPLSLRSWRPGDRFRPLGMMGRKKVQDLFVDAKVPRRERGRIPLLLAEDRIVWVVGHRIGEDFRFPGRGPACLAEVEFLGGKRQEKMDQGRRTTDY